MRNTYVDQKGEMHTISLLLCDKTQKIEFLQFLHPVLIRSLIEHLKMDLFESMENMWEWVKSYATMDTLIFYCVFSSFINILIKFLLFLQKENLQRKFKKAEKMEEIKNEFDELLTDDFQYSVTKPEENETEEEKLDHNKINSKILELRSNSDIDHDNDSELLLNMGNFSIFSNNLSFLKMDSTFVFSIVLLCQRQFVNYKNHICKAIGPFQNHWSQFFQ